MKNFWRTPLTATDAPIPDWLMLAANPPPVRDRPDVILLSMGEARAFAAACETAGVKMNHDTYLAWKLGKLRGQ